MNKVSGRVRLSLFELDSKRLRQNAKALRASSTPSERKLWRYLRNGNLLGYKFRRQFPVGIYVLDFFCYEAMLGIELDGGHHADDEIAEYDKIRTSHLESQNTTVLRFWNNEVMNNLKGVLETIEAELRRD